MLELVTHDRESQQRHLNADAVALGLIGALEILWQGIAFQTEGDVDRAGAQRRCAAYWPRCFRDIFRHRRAPRWSSPTDAMPWSASAAFARLAAGGACAGDFGNREFLSLELATTALWYCAMVRSCEPSQQLPPSAPRPGQGAERSFPGPYACPCTNSILRCRAALLIKDDSRLVAMDLTTVAGLLFVSDGATPAPRAIR